MLTNVSVSILPLFPPYLCRPMPLTTPCPAAMFILNGTKTKMEDLLDDYKNKNGQPSGAMAL